MARILIDGYNLLAVSGHKGRDALLDDLARFRKARGHEIRIVFDGTHGGQGDLNRDYHGGVEIYYTPLTVTADDVIEEILEGPGASQWLVVSSDRRIQSAARKARATFVKSDEFSARMRHVPEPREEREAPPWMEGRDEDSCPKSPAKGKGKKNKEDRQRQMRLKKL